MKKRFNPEFWGRAGSGILFVANDDTVLLTLRSSHVMQPGTWGIPGGAVAGTEGYHESDEGERFKFTYQQAWKSAVRETKEEIGYFPQKYSELGYVQFEQGTFVFVTFLVGVDQVEQLNIAAKARLDPHEATDMAWFPLSRLKRYKNYKQLERSLHFGVKHVMDMIARGI
jgi:8-oxo-dGTP pyrophosphatase MutT (NUDIX family)